MAFGDLSRINTNIQAMDAQLSLNRINDQLANNELQMSTGKRINKAEDDSAGYSIAAKLRSRVAGLNQSMQNVGDAKSVLSIAESSYNSVMDNLVQMKSLSTQAANDTLGPEERGYIGDQIKALGDDINKIADQTVYQDYQLLNGNVNAGGTVQNTGKLSMTFQVGDRSKDTITANISAVNVGQLFNGGTATANLGATGSSANITASAAGAGSQGALTFSSTATAADFRNFIGKVDNAISDMAANVNSIGITQSSLTVRENTLSQSISSDQSAKSRIMDTDFAKAKSEQVRLQILQQTATSALAQANKGPQSVLSFLR